MDTACKTDKIDSVATHIFNLVLWRYRMLWFLKECKASTQKMTNEIIKESIKKLCKISSSGAGFNAVLTLDLDDKGNPKPMYSPNAVRTALEGFYDKNPFTEL